MVPSVTLVVTTIVEPLSQPAEEQKVAWEQFSLPKTLNSAVVQTDARLRTLSRPDAA